MASIKCGHCTETHESVAEVRACARHAETHGMASVVKRGELFTDVPEQPKVSYSIRRPGENAEFVSRPLSVDALDDTMPRNGESFPEQLPGRHNPQHGSQVDAPVKTKSAAAEGMYRKAGSIYKVQKAVHGSGRNYAKRLVQALANDPKTGKPKFKFEYAPGFVYELRSEHMLTLEQAKEFGALYGTCCVCGRTLTKEESIAAGIGPICAEKFSL